MISPRAATLAQTQFSCFLVHRPMCLLCLSPGRCIHSLILSIAVGLGGSQACSAPPHVGVSVWQDLRVARRGALDTTTPCGASSDCPCNEVQNPGERFEIVRDAVQECLGRGTDEDRTATAAGKREGVLGSSGSPVGGGP